MRWACALATKALSLRWSKHFLMMLTPSQMKETYFQNLRAPSEVHTVHRCSQLHLHNHTFAVSDISDARSTFWVGCTFATGSGRVVGDSLGHPIVRIAYHRAGWIGSGDRGWFWATRGCVHITQGTIELVWTAPSRDKGNTVSWCWWNCHGLTKPFDGCLHQALSSSFYFGDQNQLYVAHQGSFPCARHFYSTLVTTPILTVLNGLGLIDLPPLPLPYPLLHNHQIPKIYFLLKVCSFSGYCHQFWIHLNIEI